VVIGQKRVIVVMMVKAVVVAEAVAMVVSSGYLVFSGEDERKL
jgi:hypothetical protein